MVDQQDMRLPKFLTSRAQKIAPTPAAGVPDAYTIPNFPGHTQGRSNWCWAAAAASMLECVAARSAQRPPLRRQCWFVKNTPPGVPQVCTHIPPRSDDSTGLSDDCPSKVPICFGTSAGTNIQGRLDAALNIAQLRAAPPEPFPAHNFQAQMDLHRRIKAQISLNIPVGAHWIFHEQGAREHFVVLCGYVWQFHEYVYWDPAHGFASRTVEKIGDVATWDFTIFLQ
jgi:hypothetical protein